MLSVNLLFVCQLNEVLIFEVQQIFKFFLMIFGICFRNSLSYWQQKGTTLFVCLHRHACLWWYINAGWHLNDGHMLN